MPTIQNITRSCAHFVVDIVQWNRHDIQDHDIWEALCVLLTNYEENLPVTPRRHQMETFSALLCEENSLVPGGFPSQRPVTPSFDVFFDLLTNKRLSKHSRRRRFETPALLLWRHCVGLQWLYIISHFISLCDFMISSLWVYATRLPI